MKPEVTLKYLSYLRNKKQNGEEGFTLIELLVVVIIIGVLAAVALPNLLSQVGKARETEIKNAVGTVNRSQQAYHFERQTFGSNLDLLGLTIQTSYIDDPDAAITTSTNVLAEYVPTNAEYLNDGTRSYSGAIANNGPFFQSAICQSDSIASTTGAPTVTAGATGTSTCPAGSTLIK
jgi:type IV pilus assembly protein PilA